MEKTIATCGSNPEIERLAATASNVADLLRVNEVPCPQEAPRGVPPGPGAAAQVGVRVRHARAVPGALLRARRRGPVPDQHEPVRRLHGRHRQEIVAFAVADAAL